MTINKYQEAIKRVELDFEDSIEKDNIGMVGRIDIERLQELVDKETPKKPRYRPSGNIKCGCGLQMYEEQQDWYRYCSSCGQRIDWSEDE